MRAALEGNARRARQLVELGAPLGLADASRRHYTALHWAAVDGFEDVAEVLLDGKYAGHGGAAIDARGRDGWTPLMCAASFGRAGAVHLLLARGARQELQTERGFTALHLAVSRDHVGLVEMLSDGPGAARALAQRNRDGHTPLGYAVAYGRPESEKVLRARGAPEA
jgi:ankyrin repeat protein